MNVLIASKSYAKGEDMPIIKMQSSTNEVIYVESKDTALTILEVDAVGKVQFNSSPKIAAKFQDVGKSISNVCSEVFQQVKDGVESPSELTLEFSVTLSGELGIPIIGKTSGEATLSVTAVWKK
jgi:hypothetical protein